MRNPRAKWTLLSAGLCAWLGAEGVGHAQGAPRPAPSPAVGPSVVPGSGPLNPTSPGLAPAAPEPAGVPLSLLEVMRTTLRLHPEIRRARAELATRTAELGAARGPFDPLFTANAGHNHDVQPSLPARGFYTGQPVILTDTTSLGIGASLATQWGTSIAPSVGLERDHLRAAGGVPSSSLPSDPVQRAHVSLKVIQPLLRGAGSVGAASSIDAARLAQKAATFSIAHTAQQQVYFAIVAYWQLVAATQQLSLLRATQGGANELVEETKLLVASDQRPRSDLRQLEGNLAIRTRAVREAENNELGALYALYDAMGLSAAGQPDWRPADSLPAVELPTFDRAALVHNALGARNDLRASREVVASAAQLLRGAEWNTKPELDLNGTVGYAGALERDGVDAFFLAAGQNVPGVNAGVGLSLELPFNNTARKADRDLRRAAYDQATIDVADITRRLPSDVLSALDDLRLSAAALEASTAAVRQYEQAITDQHDRLHEGAGTVIDMVLTQDNLIRAQQNQTGDHLRYALALARLRFEMGLLPARDEDAMGAIGGVLGPGEPHAGQ